MAFRSIAYSKCEGIGAGPQGRSSAILLGALALRLWVVVQHLSGARLSQVPIMSQSQHGLPVVQVVLLCVVCGSCEP